MNSHSDSFQGIVDLFRNSVEDSGAQPAFTCLEFHGRGEIRRETRLTVVALDARARAIAVDLERRGMRGERALLMYRHGLDFVTSFLGCLYAGVIAVPSALPRAGTSAARARAIAGDAGARLALTTRSTRAAIETFLGEGRGIECVATDAIETSEGDGWTPCAPAADDVALLQYSSGSTGEPKGVVITHRNLAHQAELLYAEVDAKAEDCWLTWLPMFHDMGLVSAVVAPLMKRIHSVMMPPEAFVAKPSRWLRALGDFRATCCASPNFGYELCVRRAPDDELDGVDLSALRYAVTGAEPIRAETVERFCRRFAGIGLGADVLYPAYGLAEATLLVTGRGNTTRIEAFDTDALENGRAESAIGRTATRIVSSGAPRGGNEVRIVDPDSGQALPQGRVGEIWVCGGGVGRGYWNGKGDEDAFGARIDGAPDKAYLRTGDLGFLHEGELFVRGRLKDLIIIRGQNHHPADIEMTVESCHAALAPSGGAAFSIDVAGEELLVVVHELDRHADLSDEELDEVIRAIRGIVAERHHITPYAIALLPGGLPRTSSGKVRRGECRARYLAGTLRPACLWNADIDGQGDLPDEDAVGGPLRQRITCELWLARFFNARRELGAPRAEAGTPLHDLHMDAETLTTLSHEIKGEYGLALSYASFVEHETLGHLAEWLAEQVQSREHLVPEEGGRLLAGQLVAQAAPAAAQAGQEPIAIVGIACRFPSMQGPREFWDNISQGLDAVTEIPPERWDGDALYDPNPLAVGKMNTRRGGFLRDIENFDARFFGIQAREATRMDPAHRILLELSWEVFEDAGMPVERVSGAAVGVYIGISGSDYAQLQFGDEALSDPYAGIGCALTNAASRISHFLNLRGPALAVDSACSSSLSSVHMACMAIRSGECEMSLAGGVNIILSPTVTMSLSKAGMMAPDGRCKTFDQSANGYVRSEGAGLVLLKPLSRARADGDLVYAVIRGSASNQDGRSSAISAPNGEAQQRVVMAACENAGIAPGHLDYIEAHGTGTALGDPIEVNALGEVLRIGAEEGTYCAIGSVKTNIGHCESAAGIASLIKTAMVFERGQIPPSLHFTTPNSMIPFDRYRVRVQETLESLPERARPRLAGVNSFGIGGTNVHLVLEEVENPAEPKASATAERPHLLLLSAKQPAALKASAAAMASYLRNAGDDASLGDVCHTLARRRTHLDQRLALAGGDRDTLAAQLESFARTGHAEHASTGTAVGEDAPKLAFVFSGQGSQWWAMGRRLLETEAVFRDELGRCDAELRRHTGWSLIDVLGASEQESLLNDTAYAQPTMFALQLGLVALLQSWGVRPDAVVGHSFGEIAAAHVAGAIRFEDACAMIAVRARLMQPTLGRGRMVSIELPRDRVEAQLAALGGELSIAATNGPGTTVVSGPHAALDHLMDGLREQGVTTVEFGQEYAFHSAQMDDVRDVFEREIGGIRPTAPGLALMSTVTADWITTPLGPDYWGANIRGEVRFRDAIESMARSGIQLFVEVGAHPVLSGAVSRILKGIGARGQAIATLERGQDDQCAMLRTVGALYANGRQADWNALLPGRFLRGLPHYAWDRQRFWMDASHLESRIRVCRHPLLSTRMPVAQPTWQSRLDAQSRPYLAGLRVGGDARMANALGVELALGAFAQDHAGGIDLIDAHFDEMALGRGEVLPTLQTCVAETRDNGCCRLRVAAQTDDSEGRARNWHAVLSCQAKARPDSDEKSRGFDPKTLQQRCGQRYAATEIYRKLGEIGIEYAPASHIADEVLLGDRCALLSLKLAEMVEADAGRCMLHPLAFEAMEQACRLAVGSGVAAAQLRHLDRLRVYADAAHAAWAYCELLETHGAPVDASAGKAVRANAWLLDGDGGVVAVAEGIEFVARRAAEGGHFDIPGDIDRWRYRVEWAAAPVEAAVSNEAGDWLLLADRRGVAAALAAALRAVGQRCVLAHAGDQFERLLEDEYTLNPASEGDIARLLDEAFIAPGRALRGAVHCWSLDVTPVSALTGLQWDADHALGVLAMSDLVRSLSVADLDRAPRLWVVTAGAQPVGDGSGEVQVAQSLVWGCAKSVVLEHAELRCARVDLDPARPQGDAAQLCAELLAGRVDDQIAFRSGERHIARLAYERAPGDRPVREGDQQVLPYRVVRVENAAAVVAERRRGPGAHQAEIAIEAAAVPHRGPTPDGDAKGVVFEQCVGRVTRLGPEVEGLEEGQAVYVLADGELASHRVLQDATMVALPEALDSNVAVGSVRDYVAALYVVRHATAVTRSDRVLVRAGANRAALAAVSIARMAGARVFVAASPSLAAEMERLKPAWVFDERDPAAYLEVARLTEGSGVEVLLNYDEGFDTSLCARLIRPFGRCADLRRERDPRLPEGVPGSVAYHGADVAGLAAHRPLLFRELAQEALALLADGTCPPLPTALVALDSLLGRPWPHEDALVMLPPVVRGASHGAVYRADATYVLTGGLGGLGLNIARRMVREGARNLVLLGRRPPSLAALDTLAELEAFGAKCAAMAVDVADEDALGQAFDHIRATMPPIRGVIHAAGILDNGLLVQMGHAQVLSVMPAKVDGAWNLHRLTQADPIEFFVLFSSLASFIGSPGQSNYAAANAFLEALAEHRRANGLPATSIAWGPWAEAGMAADAHNLQRLAQHGMGMLSLEKGLDLLEDVVVEHVQGAIGALPMNWGVWARTRGYAAQTPYFSGLVPAQAMATTAYGKITAQSLSGLSPDEQLERIRAQMLRAVCQSLMLDADAVDIDLPMTALGLDSIIALELKDRIESAIDVVVRTNALIAGKSISAFAHQFREELVSGTAGARPEAAAAATAAADDDSARVLNSLGELSAEEVDALLKQVAAEDAAA